MSKDHKVLKLLPRIVLKICLLVCAKEVTNLLLKDPLAVETYLKLFYLLLKSLLQIVGIKDAVSYL